MRPLSVALLTRTNLDLSARLPGWWSYAVREFVVTHYPVGKGFCLSRDEMSERHDLILVEDGKTWGEIVGRARIPVCYLVTDSTLSAEHYRHRLEQARQADLVLVDWDRLERFEGLGKPVRRWSYCVNDLIFRDWGAEKTVDVAYHASLKGCPERVELSGWLERFCEARGYRYACGRRIGTEYAMAFNRARVVVDALRTPETRNHQTMDAMASFTCLITNPLPEVSGEEFVAGVHYLPWRALDDLGSQIDRALSGERWWQVADAAHSLVQEKHTWRVRATGLRRIVDGLWPGIGGRSGCTAAA